MFTHEMSSILIWLLYSRPAILTFFFFSGVPHDGMLPCRDDDTSPERAVAGLSPG